MNTNPNKRSPSTNCNQHVLIGTYSEIANGFNEQLLIPHDKTSSITLLMFLNTRTMIMSRCCTPMQLSPCKYFCLLKIFYCFKIALISPLTCNNRRWYCLIFVCGSHVRQYLILSWIGNYITHDMTDMSLQYTHTHIYIYIYLYTRTNTYIFH